MDDERWEPGMPILDRQAVAPGPATAATARTPRARVPQRVPETRPTPLQAQFIYLSAFALVCGTVAISALELGASLGSPLVKLCVILGAPPLALATGDATLRIWRSAWAWLPVDAGRAWFRFAWVAASITLLVLLAAASWLVVTA